VSGFGWALLLVGVLLLSKLVPLIPGKREREIARLRQVAYRLGMRVKFIHHPETDQKKVAYFLPWQERNSTIHSVRTFSGFRESSENWQQRLQHHALESLAGFIPEWAEGLEIDARGISLIWPEKGTDEDVESLLKSIEALQEKITSENRLLQ
jgi:hypothetical protein